MPRAKFQTLTEQMFYVLLCLVDECYGMDILDRVPAMTANRVSVGSGTLYNLLEQFSLRVSSEKQKSKDAAAATFSQTRV